MTEINPKIKEALETQLEEVRKARKTMAIALTNSPGDNVGSLTDSFVFLGSQEIFLIEWLETGQKPGKAVP